MAVTTAPKINSLQDALTSYVVTFEQVSKVTLCESNGLRYAIVESQTEVGKEYRVEYNPLFKVLTCNCPAGQEGIGCWHRRAALAQIAIDKLETRKAIDAAIAEERQNAREEEKPRYVRANRRYGGIVDATSQERNHERGEFHFMR